MLTKISRIWAVGLVLVTVASLLFSALPVSAGILTFSTESIPSTANNVLGPAGIQILDLAVAADGKTIFVAASKTGDTSNVFKSTDGGITWTDTTGSLGAAIVTSQFIAVAPDDANIVVVVDGTAGATAAFVSTNGGSTWATMALPTGAGIAYFDVDISAVSSGVRQVAVAGTAGANAPRLQSFNLGSAAPAWTDIINDATWSGFTALATVDSIKAAKLSPNYASDRMIVAVSEDLGATGAMRLHAASYASKKWDTTAGFTGYAVSLQLGSLATFAVNSAFIALDPAYLGADDTSRLAFIGADVTNSGIDAVGGVYRAQDTNIKKIKDTTDIKSVAYDGTNLVAGQVSSNAVYYSSDPNASSPTVNTARTFKRPGIDLVGSENTIVAFAGTSVVAGTGNGTTVTANAFAVSKNNGVSFNDVSLVATNAAALGTLEDFWVTPDAAKRFLLASDTVNTSLWRYDGSWQRVWSISGVAGYILRGAPANNDVLYIADTASTNLFYTADAGEQRWSIRAAASNVGDLAVESDQVAYIAVNAAATVSKTTNAGFTWGSAVNSQLAGGNISQIKSLAADKLIVGSTTGYVSYSTDANATWVKLTKQTDAAATTTVVTASGLADKDYIYASSAVASAKVMRWQIGVSTDWKDMSATTTVGAVTYGAFDIVLKGSALYVALKDVAPTTASRVARTLGPTSESVTWSYIDVATNFNTAPQALRVSAGSTKLWAINTAAANNLYSYTDTLDTAGPTIVTPTDKVVVAMNNITGKANDMVFQWNRPSENVTAYELRIYQDTTATQQLINVAVASTSTTPSAVVGPNQPITFVEFAPGKTYYWKVRASAPVYSAYSDLRSFNIEPGLALVPDVLSPANGVTGTSLTPSFSWSPISGATEYEFQLAAAPYNESFASAIASVKGPATGVRPIVKLDYDRTYFWRVRVSKPTVGAFSAVSNFTTMAEPAAPPPPPITITSVPPPVITLPPAPQPTQIVIPPPPAPQYITPTYIWAVIIIGAVLVIAVIILIVRTRRPA